VLLALAGLKGGVGKTTAAVSLAVECFSRGYRVLLLDLDPLGTLHHWAEQAIERGQPTPPTLALGHNVPGPEGLRALAQGYDLVILDCPPADVEILQVALMATDVAVLPCTPKPLDVWALGPTLQIVEAIRKQRPTLETPVLINRRDDRTMAAARVRAGLIQHGLPLLDTMLGARVAFGESIAMGQGVTQYDSDSRAADEVRSLVDELGRYTLAPSLAPHAMH
jgi:chromosome partitioning protein